MYIWCIIEINNENVTYKRSRTSVFSRKMIQKPLIVNRTTDFTKKIIFNKTKFTMGNCFLTSVKVKTRILTIQTQGTKSVTFDPSLFCKYDFVQKDFDERNLPCSYWNLLTSKSEFVKIENLSMPYRTICIPSIRSSSTIFQSNKPLHVKVFWLNPCWKK